MWHPDRDREDVARPHFHFTFKKVHGQVASVEKNDLLFVASVPLACGAGFNGEMTHLESVRPDHLSGAKTLVR